MVPQTHNKLRKVLKESLNYKSLQGIYVSESDILINLCYMCYYSVKFYWMVIFFLSPLKKSKSHFLDYVI